VSQWKLLLRNEGFLGLAFTLVVLILDALLPDD